MSYTFLSGGSAMSHGSAPITPPDQTRIDRLLRSVAGVSDLALTVSATGRLTAVSVLRAPHIQQHQIVRNIVSAMHAAFAIRLEQRQVHVHDTVDTFGPARVSSPAPAATPLPKNVAPLNGNGSNGNGASHGAHGNGNGNGSNGNGHGHGNGHGSNGNGSNGAATKVDAPATAASPVSHARVDGVVAEARPLGHAAETVREVIRQGAALIAGPADPVIAKPVAAARSQRAGGAPVQLERIDFERRGATARCRVELKQGSLSFAAVAEALDGPTVEAELAARVTLDALRAAGMTTAELQGVKLVAIAKMDYVVAAVRHNAGEIPLAGAAPLVDSVAWSAAATVLSAAGFGVSELAPVPVPVGRHETVYANQTP